LIDEKKETLNWHRIGLVGGEEHALT